MYTGKIALTNPKGIPFSLSNEFDDTMSFREAIEDCENAEEARRVANKMGRYKRQWTIVRNGNKYTRLSSKDILGNVRYLILYKEI